MTLSWLKTAKIRIITKIEVRVSVRQALWLRLGLGFTIKFEVIMDIF